MVRSRAVQVIQFPVEQRPIEHSLKVDVAVPRWPILLTLVIVQAVTLALTLGLYLRPYLTP